MKNEVILGKLLKGGEKRDAVHIAIAPCVAQETLHPGQRVTADGKGTFVSVSVGIVDPYLQGTVKIDEQFYIFLHPNTVTSLRHEWEHPAFKEDEVALDNLDDECSC